MKYRYLLALFTFAGISLSSMGAEIDSLKHRLKATNEKSELGKIHSRLGWLHIVSDPELAKSYIDTAIQHYSAIADSSGIANSWYRYGVLYRFVGDYDKAESFMDKNLAFYSARSDTLQVVNTLFQKGVIYSLEGRYDKSLEAYFNVLKTYQSLGDSTSMGFTLNSIGIVFKNMRKYSEAKAVFERSISIHRTLGDLNNLANAISNLGSVHAESGNHQKAIGYFREAGAIDRKLGNLWGEAVNEMNEGTAHINLGKYTEAIPHLERAQLIQSKNGYSADLAECLAQLGSAHLAIHEVGLAENHVRNGLELNVSSLGTNLKLYEVLSDVFERKGMFREAFHAKKMQVAYQDSIFNETNAKMANIWAAEYGINIKDQQLAEKDDIIGQRDTIIYKMRSKNMMAIGIGGVGVFVAFLLLFFYRQQQKLKNQEIENLHRQKEIAALESYIQGEENERKRLAQDLHDGLNGDLSVVKYKISSMEVNGDLEVRRSEATELIDKACAQVRAISHNLAPQLLNDFSLGDAVEQYVIRLNSGSSIRFAFQYFGDSINLEIEKMTVIFRMIQEMANNIVKHSQASDALIQLNCHEDDLVLTIEDNGIGFNTDQISEGIGLKTIRSRVVYLNAECDFSSSDEGTSFVIHIPISKTISA